MRQLDRESGAVLQIFFENYMTDAAITRAIDTTQGKNPLVRTARFLHGLPAQGIADISNALIKGIGTESAYWNVNRRDVANAYLEIAPLQKIPEDRLTTMYTESIDEIAPTADLWGSPFSLVTTGEVLSRFIGSNPHSKAAIEHAWEQVQTRMASQENWEPFQQQIDAMLESYEETSLSVDVQEHIIFEKPRKKSLLQTARSKKKYLTILATKQLHSEGKRPVDIAKALDVAASSVTSHMTLLAEADEITRARKGVEGNPDERDARRAVIKSLAASGKTPLEIAEITQLSETKIEAHLFMLRIVPEGSKPRVLVAESASGPIKSRREALVPLVGVITIEALAKRFGCSVGTISNDYDALEAQGLITKQQRHALSTKGNKAERIIEYALANPKKKGVEIARALGVSPGHVSITLKNHFKKDPPSPKPNYLRSD